MAFLSLDIKKNDSIIIPAVNFIASYNMLSILGANIYLCDVDPQTGQMSPESISECIKLNKLKKSESPINMQKQFLKKTYDSLRENGKLYLAIENRFDFKFFLGIKDPHTQTYFTTIFPKKIVNIYFKIFKNKEYKTWIYSFGETKKIIESIGFKNIEVYSSWPDYHFPEQIYEYGKMDSSFKLSTVRRNGKIKFKLLIKRFFEFILFKLLKLDFFAPAIIIVAKK